MKFILLLVLSTVANAAPVQVDYKPSTINIAKEMKKCQCKCKGRTNMTDLMDAKEFLEQELQKIEGQSEQKLN